MIPKSGFIIYTAACLAEWLRRWSMYLLSTPVRISSLTNPQFKQSLAPLNGVWKSQSRKWRRFESCSTQYLFFFDFFIFVHILENLILMNCWFFPLHFHLFILNIMSKKKGRVYKHRGAVGREHVGSLNSNHDKCTTHFHSYNV